MKEELGMCYYCGRTGRKKNLARIIINDEKFESFHCPRCLPDVERNIRGLDWYQKHTVDYPYK